MTTRIKILYLVCTPGISIQQSGGAGTHIRGTIHGLEESGFQIMPVIAGDFLKNQPGNIKELQEKNIFKSWVKAAVPNKIRLFIRDFRSIIQDFRFRKKLVDAIRSFKPDIIYERSSYLSTIGVTLAKVHSIPILIESDGCMVEIISNDYGVFSIRAGNAIEKWKLNKADHIVVMSKFSKKAIADKFGIKDPSKFIFKPLGVDLNTYPVNQEFVEKLIRKYNLSNKFVCGFIGAISKYHGVELLIEAAAQLKNDSSIVFIIVGWSAEALRLQDLVHLNKLQNVIFTGKVDKDVVGNYYSLFSLGIIPDADENLYPIKVLEYGNFGICPLVPDYPVFNEIISNGQNGFTFSKRDSTALAKQIGIIKKLNTYRSIGGAWRKDVLNNFEWSKSVQELSNSIRSIMEKN